LAGKNGFIYYPEDFKNMRNLIVIGILFFNNFFQNENPLELILKEEISIVSHNTYYNLDNSILSITSNEYILLGELIFRNNTNKTIKVPKHIVLYFMLTDDKGNEIPLRTDVHYDNPVLVFFSKPVEIPESKDLSIKFSDIRLMELNMKKGEKYYIQYYFHVNGYKKLKRQIKTEVISSNIVEFEFLPNSDKTIWDEW